MHVGANLSKRSTLPLAPYISTLPTSEAVLPSNDGATAHFGWIWRIGDGSEARGELGLVKGVAGLQSGGLGGEKEGSMVAPESVVGLGEAGGGCDSASDGAKEPKETPRDSMTSISSKTASKIQPAHDEQEALRARLEAIGMHVGANFSERCTAPPCAYISTYVSSDCAGTNLSLRKR
ncbi:hypothetical protein AX14_008993 [Amanita brunnescens Koide BX004]|nr:hypothetical protein AX14_008993 [Amanita brunnescens Koide BX004]